MKSQVEHDGAAACRHNAFPSGLSATSADAIDGTRTVSLPNGTVVTTTLEPDPRFGMLAPLESTVTTTPSLLERTVTRSRAVTLADPADPLSLLTLTETTEVNGRAFVRSFDVASLTWTLTTPEGRVSTRTVDTAGHTIAEAVAGLTPTTLLRDAQGRLSSQTQGARTTSYGYGSDGLLSSLTDALSHQSLIGRDGAGRVVSMTRPDGESTSLGYAPKGNTLSVTPPGQPAHGFGYTPVDLLASYLPPDAGFSPRDTQYSYDLDRNLTLLTQPDGKTLSYGFDTAGRASTVTAPSAVRTRAYDLVTGMLSSTSAPGVTLGFGYDGTLLTEMTWAGDVNGSVAFAYDAQDRMTSYADATYDYTDNGELEAKTTPAGTTQYEYDVLGNLRSVTLPSGKTIAYVVDGLGRRVGRKVDGLLTGGLLYRDALRPIAALGPDGSTVEAVFVYASRANVPDYMLKGGNAYRFISDQVGSVRLVVDAVTGTVVQRLDYDAWGVVLSDTAHGFQPFGFAGGLYDPDTGLVRFGARDYDPETGRWTSKDPIGFRAGHANLYSYVRGDPVDEIDPGGRLGPLATLGLYGLASGGGAAVGTALMGGSLSDIGKAFVGGFAAGVVGGIFPAVAPNALAGAEISGGRSAAAILISVFGGNISNAADIFGQLGRGGEEGAGPAPPSLGAGGAGDSCGAGGARP